MISYDPFNKPNKAYRTLQDAFKDKDYACSVEGPHKDYSFWWVIPLWIVVICATMLCVWVVASVNVNPIGN
jgi:hypothetical protein